jgi:hypothetical protein
MFENLIRSDSPGFYYSYYIGPGSQRAKRQVRWVYRTVGTLVTAALLMVPG